MIEMLVFENLPVVYDVFLADNKAQRYVFLTMPQKKAA